MEFRKTKIISLKKIKNNCQIILLLYKIFVHLYMSNNKINNNTMKKIRLTAKNGTQTSFSEIVDYTIHNTFIEIHEIFQGNLVMHLIPSNNILRIERLK